MARPRTFRQTVTRGTRVMRHFSGELAQEKTLICGSLAALLGSVAFQLLEPWPLKFVIDAIATDPQASAADGRTLGWAAVGLVAIVLGRAGCDYVRAVGFALLGNRVTSQVRGRTYRHLQTLSLRFHDGARSGDLLIRVVSDLKMLRDVAVTALLPMVASLLVLGGMLAVMAWLNWQLTLVALGIVPLYALSSLRLGRKLHEAARKQRRREGAMAASAAEALSAVRVVQALSLEGRFGGQFEAHNRRSLSDGVKTGRLTARMERTADVLVAVATAGVMWTGARMAISGAMTAGDLLVFLTYLKRAFRPLQDFAKYAARMAKATAAGERVVELLESEPEVQDAPHAVDAPRLRGELSLEGVRFGYDADRPVYERLDLRFPAGKLTAVVGASGAGKSSLLSLGLRLYDPQAGAVRIDGVDVREWKLASLRRQISVVWQDTVLFAGTVYENVALGADEIDAAAVEAAARLANAHEFICALPDGYDTQLGERGANLSRGQRQRLAIARAAIRDAPLLFLDEPTSGLDEANERAVNSALRRLAVGKTAVLVTHDLRAAAEADWIVLIEGGCVVEQGRHEELVAHGGHYAALWQAAALSLHSPRIVGDRHGVVV